MSALAYRPSISNSHAIRPSRPARTSVVDLGILLAIALVAFEVFSFDMSHYALGDLLADVSFAGLRWATILAIAFSCIDFAGLLRFFALEQEQKHSAESWYWIGAWLLGGTMQALLAWWTTATILVSHSSDSGLLSSPQMLTLLPLSVAILVWVTRILFIGVLAVAGDSVFGYAKTRPTHTIRRPMMDYKYHPKRRPGSTHLAGRLAPDQGKPQNVLEDNSSGFDAVYSSKTAPRLLFYLQRLSRFCQGQ